MEMIKDIYDFLYRRAPLFIPKIEEKNSFDRSIAYIWLENILDIGS